MKKSVRIRYGMLIIGVLLLLTGCIGNDALNTSDPTSIRIAMVPKIMGISYFDKCADGARVAAEKYGMEIIYKGPTTADAAAQVNIIQDMIYNEVDVIVIAPVDPNAVKPLLLKAREKGIIVVTYDADSAKGSRDIFVSQVSAEVLGKHIMDNVAEALGNKGEFAILTASLTAENQNKWIEWIKFRQAEKYKDMTLVSVVPCDEDPQKSYVNTRNLIQAYPELKGVIAMSTVVGPAAFKAVSDLGKSDDLFLYGLALPNDSRQYLKDGSAKLVTLWNPYDLGALTVEVINRLIKNETFKSGDIYGDIGPIEYVEAENTVIMGEPLDFSAENVDNYDF